MKFSIITPSFNMERFIAKTIESIISQKGNFEIEYILADGKSSDKTVAIFKEYQSRLESGAWNVGCQSITMQCLSEKDAGTFDAINKGFNLATGDLITWCDADNTFDPGAFDIIARTFETYPKTEWVIAVGDTMNDRWEKTRSGVCQLYNQKWLQRGVYGREAYFVVQNGCFWRRELWHKTGPIPTTFKVAGDYWLWMQMASHAAPLALNAHISNFMRREGQLHLDGTYFGEQVRARPHRSATAWLARLYFWPYFHIPTSWRPMFEKLYPFFFPIHPRNYATEENGRIVQKTMPSFVLH